MTQGLAGALDPVVDGLADSFGGSADDFTDAIGAVAHAHIMHGGAATYSGGVTREPLEPRKQQVYSITTAATSHSDDIGGRERRYAISMAIRTLCFVGAIIADGWLRWVLVAGALLLPYTSVILANAGVRQRGSGPSVFGPEKAIEAPRPSQLDE
ncbi:hypothetical protein GCM10022234_33350 [Aeromicrobium panaciterrae]